ncbi:MAG: ACT domain-containing protein [Clostridium sp.]|uniref:ACT domain-containing protein n=2 Tax=Clostridium TaxID=1485 RepID=UPI0021523561|nr:ACT domain-containing protein [Clostridium sp. LY3-2]MCR6515754.1 ACT domain-containing protein [Clostridium sp. LY3-2]
MKGILTVIGRDEIGIIACISNTLSKLNINILDVNQTIMNSHFTMFMVVDLIRSDFSFDEIKNELTNLGQKMNLDIKIQREEIFESMHNI